MSLGKLKDVLDNIGPGIHDVSFYNFEGDKLCEVDLKGHDFDNIEVISKHLDPQTVNSKWVVMNIVLSIKKAA